MRLIGVRLRMNTRGYSADQSLMSDPARECSCMSIQGLRAFDRGQTANHTVALRAQPGPSVPGSLINERPGKSMWHRCHMDLQTGNQSGRPAALVAPSGRATNLAGLPGWVPPAYAEAGVHSSLRLSP